ncbi:MAG: restriction endonuclease subunit S [Nostoc sp. DedSLP03]|uniref:restriction endonuclease subunit S n=1 Tax=Nostoc sp. DedSLP03 TaxID=3075400 RepID=UPI002AD3CFDE|nr:restriction endonuclease subunit S [Nostoc sp. DedSLP03]MDZ7970122.1 restriction endonuclease subunit S [Nostoc sp. DedSLP03]
MKIERAGYKVVPLKTLLTTSVRNGYSPVCPEAESGNWVLGLGALNGNGFDPSQKKPAPPNDQKIQDFLLSKGDFLVSRSNTLDKVGRASLFRGEIENCAYPDLMMRFRVDEKKVNLEYLDTYLKSENIRHYFQIHAAGSSGSMVKITKSILEETPILLPPLPEQEKIASFLGAVDTRLNQLRRKRELLHTYKRGVMQKIFSQEIRFKQDDGFPFPNWQERKLGDITYKVGEKNKESIAYPIYSINNKTGFVPQSEQFDGVDSNDRGYDISLYKIIKKNTFAYNPARINVGSIGFSRDLENIIISSLYVCFQTKNQLNNLYLLQYINTFNFNKSVLRNVEGGVRNYLFFENFSNIKIPLPCLEEQQKIVTFLTVIDRKIETLSRKIEQTEKFKKGLLQKLFI